MLLNKLVIKKGDIEFRKVVFKKGLNLIISKGNSVGKTTLLRSIDYCFGSSGDDFYKDNEFKNNQNTTVYNFLKSNNIKFELTFSTNGNIYQISRRFDTTEGLKINQTKYNNLESYKKALNKIIFGIDDQKPGLRSMISKFVRKDVTKMKNMVKTLHYSASNNDYMLLYFNLFHFKEPNLIYEKSNLLIIKKKLSERLKALSSGVSKNSIKQKVKLYEEEIKEIENKIKNLDLIKSSDHLMEELKDVQKQEYLYNIEVGKLNFKISLNKESLKVLHNQKSSIKTDYIKKLYENAKIHVGELQRSLKETIDFHNKMINNKISFIEKNIDELNSKLKKIKKDLNLLEKREGDILKIIGNKNNFGSLYLLQQELSIKSQRKGAEQKLLDLINGIQKEQEDNKNMIEEIDNKISLYTSEFDDNVFIFNKYFSKYSKDLYGHNYLISFSDDYKKVIPENINFNVGGGEKKAYIGLFDLAYISYLNEIQSSFPKFVLHDSIEDTNHQSLLKLFSIANSVDGQFIVSLLNDKLNSIGYEVFEDSIILELDDSNKFFNIEKLQ